METEPLQDTLPPRYAIESDDSEDEGDAILKRSAPKAKPNVVLNWSGPQPMRQSLVVELDRVGRQWTNGVELGEVKGCVTVENVPVATAYCPSWAQVTIVLVHERLTFYAMHPFASVVIKATRPTNVVIIDAYPVPTYITSPPPLHPPIRYLHNTVSSQIPLSTGINAFRPPNLLQSPAASFLAILESKIHSLPATLLLLPSSHIPPPPPSELGNPVGPDIQEEWETSTLIELHKAVNALIGADTQWFPKRVSEHSHSRKGLRRGDIGEGGMYI